MSPSPNGANGQSKVDQRGPGGRFAPGNTGGPGNPHAAATGKGEAAANPATQARKSTPKASQAKIENPQDSSEFVGVGAACDAVESEPMPPEGLEPSTR